MIRLFISLFLFLVVSTTFDSSEVGNCHIIFSKIDNQAKVYVNGELIYESGVIDGNPDLSYTVFIDKFLKGGSNEVLIELYNGSEALYDEHWEVYYEIFQNNDPIDYIHEFSNNGKLGLAYSKTHEIIIQ